MKRFELDNMLCFSATMQQITAAAEQQMRDLLSWPSDSNLSTQTQPLHTRLKSSPHSIQVSPTSAFTPVEKLNESSISDAYSMPMTSTPKPTPTKPQTPQTVRKTDTDEPSRRHSVVSISSQPSDSTLADEGVFWANLESMLGNKKSRNRTFARSKSVFEDRNRMLFLQTYDPEATSSEDDADLKNFEPASFLTYSCNPRPGCTDDEEPAKEVVLAAGDSAYSRFDFKFCLVVLNYN